MQAKHGTFFSVRYPWKTMNQHLYELHAGRAISQIWLNTINQISVSYLFCWELLRFLRIPHEKVLFLGQIYKMEILIDLPILRSPESENHIYSDLCVCMCLTVINITQKQITAETLNSVFNICIIFRCYLKVFMKIGQIVCVQDHEKTLMYFSLWTEFLFSVI